MKILVSCEESGKVTAAMRKKGHEAYSCDLQTTRGNPAWHHVGDVLPHLNSGFWDMLIGFPPCPFMCNTANKHLWIGEDRANGPDHERWQGMFAAVYFFKMHWGCRIPKIALENPVMNPYAKAMIGAEQTQSIQPYQFGHLRTKRTCLWLKGLPPLVPTSDLKRQTYALPANVRGECFHEPPGPNRSRIRSETFQGVADAMANQWG